jgi:hypothetical protein
MGLISKRLCKAADGEGGEFLSFWCPGCNDVHTVKVAGGSRPQWGYNGNPESPTFTPSVLVRSGHHVPGYDGGGCWCDFNAEQIAMGESPSKFACGVCHSFVTDGRIQFLSDCTHGLAGQTVELPEFPA